MPLRMMTETSLSLNQARTNRRRIELGVLIQYVPDEVMDIGETRIAIAARAAPALAPNLCTHKYSW